MPDRYPLVVGSTDTVIKKLRHIRDELGIGSILLEARCGQPSRQGAARSIDRFRKEPIRR